MIIIFTILALIFGATPAWSQTMTNPDPAPVSSSQLTRCYELYLWRGQVRVSVRALRPVTYKEKEPWPQGPRYIRFSKDGTPHWDGPATKLARWCLPLDNEAGVWHLFTQTENGQVSFQHGLTENQCQYVLAMLGSWGPPWQEQMYYGMRMVRPGDLKHGECFK